MSPETREFVQDLFHEFMEHPILDDSPPFDKIPEAELWRYADYVTRGVHRRGTPTQWKEFCEDAAIQITDLETMNSVNDTSFFNVYYVMKHDVGAFDEDAKNKVSRMRRDYMSKPPRLLSWLIGGIMVGTAIYQMIRSYNNSVS